MLTTGLCSYSVPAKSSMDILAAVFMVRSAPTSEGFEAVNPSKLHREEHCSRGILPFEILFYFQPENEKLSTVAQSMEVLQFGVNSKLVQLFQQLDVIPQEQKSFQHAKAFGGISSTELDFLVVHQTRGLVVQNSCVH